MALPAASSTRHRHPKALAAFLTGASAVVYDCVQAYGRGIINAVGAEVDRLETEIKSLNPGCHYVDLETDRGRSRPAGAAGDAADLENEHEEWK